jgi:ceramide glucosyltransferase
MLADWAAGFCAVAAALQALSIAAAATRCASRRPPPPGPTPPVSIVRPLCGLDNYLEDTLASTFALDYPHYEIIFCLERADDPAAPVARRLIAAHPEIEARLLIGADTMSLNPKLNNVIKGWDAARHPWIVLSDSNVMMPRDYLRRLFAQWRDDTGLVCSMPIAARPANFWAELECAFLNTYQSRWQYAAYAFGWGFAQGKNMLFRRDIVEPLGGIRVLAAEIAEDAAVTKLVRSVDRHVRIVDRPFTQPLGRRAALEVWRRQTRWARLRRMTFPACFAPELLVGAFFPALAALYAALSFEVSLFWVAALFVAWYGTELMLAKAAQWHLSWRMPFALILRDLLLPALWLDAWIGDSYTWRGTTIDASLDPRNPAEEGAA